MAKKSYLLGVADAVRLPFPDRSVDLVFGSPPYLDCRTYGIGAQRDCAAWIQWMLDVTTEACRVSRGLVLWVVAGVVRQHCYQPGPEGLLYEWWKRGGQCWRPSYWYRSGIPGSGGQHWLRADVEYVLAFVGPDRRPRRGRPATHTSTVRDFGAGVGSTTGNGGRVVPRKNKISKSLRADDAGEPAPDDPNAFWTNNTAMGHDPKGNITNGNPGGERGKKGEIQKYGSPVLANPGNLIETTEEEGFWTDNTAMGHVPKWAPGGAMSNYQSDGTRTNQCGSRIRHKGGARDTNGKLQPNGRPSHYEITSDQGYMPPVFANPGNLIKTNSGYGSLSSPHAHDNEAPFPEALAEFFIRTVCPPGGIVLDPFSGSGTTVAVAERTGRLGLGFDIRMSQAELAVRRVSRPHSQRQRNGHPEKDLPLFSK